MSPWTTRDIPDLAGRTAVVTGANSGLGLQVSIELARHGAHVVLACRDRARGAAALERVVGSAELVVLDLADLASVRAAATEIGRSHDRLDLLVCNAGVMATPHRLTVDGFELQFGTNHLGHFALTGLVLPCLLAGMGTRVVVVSSNMHRLGRMSADDLGLDHRYQKWFAYGRSKLANLLFMTELQRRADVAGVDLTGVGAHPGWASTNLQVTGPRMAGSGIEQALTMVGNRLFGQSAQSGALPLLRAATDPNVAPAGYYGPGARRGHPGRASMSAAARDPVTARALWKESERLTGVAYEWSTRRPPG
ncbi:MAG TPA: oxidoreductase [Jiangellaceae bacterium]|nr:oxidoreductase [Jiangellaceae bacterium]